MKLLDLTFVQTPPKAAEPAMPESSDIILERLMRLHPKVIDLTLDRMWRLLDGLGNPQDAVPPVVHIAGTNGKGSTLAMIRAGLEGAGLVTHAYTSPHLARFHERIRLAGELISDDALSAALDECEAANQGAPITYFEITTAAAFLAMSRTKADFTLLEVGLGGRLDATNVITCPRLSVITPISIDHQQFLGERLAQIAFEKAGILKPSVPCVVARQTDAALEVIETQAARLGAPLIAQGQHWHTDIQHDRLVFQDETGLLDLPRPVLAGPHQIDNAGTALAALRALRAGDPEAAMSGAQWPARMQKLRAGPICQAAPQAEIWLDGGHNAAAGAAIAETLADLPDRKTHAICGMLNTKDIAGFLAPLADRITGLTAVTIPGEENALPADTIAQAAATLGIAADTAPDMQSAVQRNRQHARILICGSLYLAGHVLRDHS